MAQLPLAPPEPEEPETGPEEPEAPGWTRLEWPLLSPTHLEVEEAVVVGSPPRTPPQMAELDPSPRPGESRLPLREAPNRVELAEPVQPRPSPAVVSAAVVEGEARVEPELVAPAERGELPVEGAAVEEHR